MLLARHLASKVLPVPGGPYSSAPLGGLMPTHLKISGLAGERQFNHLVRVRVGVGSSGSENKTYS